MKRSHGRPPTSTQNRNHSNLSAEHFGPHDKQLCLLPQTMHSTIDGYETQNVPIHYHPVDAYSSCLARSLSEPMAGLPCIEQRMHHLPEISVPSSEILPGMQSNIISSIQVSLRFDTVVLIFFCPNDTPTIEFLFLYFFILFQYQRYENKSSRCPR